MVSFNVSKNHHACRFTSKSVGFDRQSTETCFYCLDSTTSFQKQIWEVGLHLGSVCGSLWSLKYSCKIQSFTKGRYLATTSAQITRSSECMCGQGTHRTTNRFSSNITWIQDATFPRLWIECYRSWSVIFKWIRIKWSCSIITDINIISRNVSTWTICHAFQCHCLWFAWYQFVPFQVQKAEEVTWNKYDAPPVYSVL